MLKSIIIIIIGYTLNIHSSYHNITVNDKKNQKSKIKILKTNLFLEKMNYSLCQMWKLTLGVKVLSDARPLHPKEDVIPTLTFQGSHPIQAVGEDPHPNSGAVIFSSMAAHQKRQVFCPTEQDRSLT